MHVHSISYIVYNYYLELLKQSDTTEYKPYFRLVLAAIGTFLFNSRIGCLRPTPPQETKDFVDHLQGFFKLMQPLMYNIPLYKVFPTKIWRQYVTHADNIFNIGRSLVDKVCYFKISWHFVVTYLKNCYQTSIIVIACIIANIKIFKMNYCSIKIKNITTHVQFTVFHYVKPPQFG